MLLYFRCPSFSRSNETFLVLLLNNIMISRAIPGSYLPPEGTFFRMISYDFLDPDPVAVVCSRVSLCLADDHEDLGYFCFHALVVYFSDVGPCLADYHKDL